MSLKENLMQSRLNFSDYEQENTLKGDITQKTCTTLFVLCVGLSLAIALGGDIAIALAPMMLGGVSITLFYVLYLSEIDSFYVPINEDLHTVTLDQRKHDITALRISPHLFGLLHCEIVVSGTNKSPWSGYLRKTEAITEPTPDGMKIAGRHHVLTPWFGDAIHIRHNEYKPNVEEFSQAANLFTLFEN